MTEATEDADARALLAPIDLGGLRLRNRLVVAPMSRVSTRGDGVATAEMARYYAGFAHGGFGLVITEGTYTDLAHSQAYTNQPGVATDRQGEAWARVADAVHAAGGRVFLQLMHAGALVQGNQYREVAVAPSAVRPKGWMLARGYGGRGRFRRPRTMTAADIAQAIEGFADAAARARDAGFDGVEVHGANGYLLDQFLTPDTNLRTDRYGGPVDNRIRLTVEVIDAVEQATGTEFPVGVRLSQGKVNDPDHRWESPAEAEVILAAVGRARPAYIHISSEDAPWRAGTELSSGATITALARGVAGVPSVANGRLDDPRQAAAVVRDGHADLVALGRGALANPDWPRRLAARQPIRAYDPGMLWPDVTLASTRRWRAEHGGRAALDR